MFEKMIEQAISWVFDTGVNLLVALLILLIGLSRKFVQLLIVQWKKPVLKQHSEDS